MSLGRSVHQSLKRWATAGRELRNLWARFSRAFGSMMSKPVPAPLYLGGPTAEQLGEESAKLRRVPGIVFANGPTGQRARIAGTGIEVFEVIETYRAVSKDRTRLAEQFDWLQPDQLAAALTYARAFPEEIERHIRLAETLEQRYGISQPAQ